MRRSIPWLIATLLIGGAVIGCSSGDPTVAPSPAVPTVPSPAASPVTVATPISEPVVAPSLPGRPDWLGERPLPTDGQGYGIAGETPTELVDRRFTTIDTLPPPTEGGFEFSVTALEGDVLARSTWHEGCPVSPEELRYLTVTFRGFDGAAHTGELIIAASVVEDVVDVFEVMWNVGFPIEEMRIVTPDDLEAEPTGDGNNTAAFVCRPVTGGSGFSEHAYGLAIDVNPFHNPYVKGDLVLPELARAYVDRSDMRPGMLMPGDPVTAAFTSFGWHWGGDWTTLRDWQHFSLTGR